MAAQTQQELTFEEFKSLTVRLSHEQNPHGLDHGRMAMAALHTARPDISKYIVGWFGVDPFYNDDNLTRFWCEVENRW